MTTVLDDMTSSLVELAQEGNIEVEDPYPGKHVCALCGETFHMARDRKGEFPPDWYFYVVHDHELDPVAWRAVLFYRPKGARYPQQAKHITGQQAAQRRESQQQRRVGLGPNASVTCVECGGSIRLMEAQAAAANGVPLYHSCGRLLVEAA